MFVRLSVLLGVVSILFLSSLSYGLTKEVFDPCSDSREFDRTPPSHDKKPIKISVGLYLLDIMSISEAKQSYKADFVFTLKWKDPRLAWSASKNELESCAVDLEKIWKPKVFIFNQRVLAKEFEGTTAIYSDGTVTVGKRYIGTLASPHDLSSFPKDQSNLEIIILFTNGPKVVEVVLDKENIGQENHFSIHNWKIGLGYAEVLDYKVPQLNKQFPSFFYSLPAKRYINFYLWKIIIPLILIIIMSWSVFWISPVHRVAQISLASAAILTTIMFQLTLTRFLPQISYLTRMDYFILFCTICVFSALIESVTTGIIAGRGEEERAIKIDKRSRILFPTIFTIVVLIIWLT